MHMMGDFVCICICVYMFICMYLLIYVRDQEWIPSQSFNNAPSHCSKQDVRMSLELTLLASLADQ